MNGHLKPEQFSESVAGFCEPEIERHLSDCAECRAEVARLQEILGGFRSSVQDWSYRKMPVARPLPLDRSVMRFTQFRTVAAVLMLAIAVLAGWMLRRDDAITGRHQPALSDAALLEQIDKQVSREVPSHLEPLLDLVAQDGSIGGN